MGWNRLRSPRHRPVWHRGADRGVKPGETRRRVARAATNIDAMFNPFWAETNSLENRFAAWVSAAHDARFAWETWSASATRDRGKAYARYRASLDREEQAAARLAAAVISAPRPVGGIDDLPAAA
jgi:hypothetical protein